MKNIRLYFISVFLSAAASAFAGPPTYELQPSPASSATAIRYTMTSATLIASSSPGNGISGQELNTKGSTLTAPITACQTTSRLSTLYWRWNTWCTIMPARVSRSIPGPISKAISGAIQSTFPGKCGSRFRSRKTKSSLSSVPVVASIQIQSSPRRWYHLAFHRPFPPGRCVSEARSGL